MSSALDAHSDAGAVHQQIAPGLWRIPLSIVNAYLVEGDEPGSWLLIDAGLRTSTDAILRMASSVFGATSEPAAIILTHGHFDHIGALHSLLDRWDVPVYAHALEAPYLRGESAYPPPDPAVGGGLMSCFSRFFPRAAIDLGNRLQMLPADGQIPFASRWRWVPTPGHTTGHVSLFRDGDRTLIAGDAFVTARQESLIGALLRSPMVWRCPAYFTSDWYTARESIAKLAELEPEVAATGHGLPMRGIELRRGLEHLLDRWEEIRPHYGRYTKVPALADEQGVVWLPPRVTDRNLLAATVGAVGLLMLIAAFRTQRQRQ